MYRIKDLVKICDVTLRDGIQNLNNQPIIGVSFKNFIIKKLNEGNIHDIEVGSNVSKKLSQMINTPNLVETFNNNKYMILVPNYLKFKETLKWKNSENIRKYSLITACSNNFILKNTRTTFNDNINEIDEIIKSCSDKTNDIKFRIYISCCFGCSFENNCRPTEQQNLLLDTIMKKYLKQPQIDEIVISDTIGTYEQNLTRLDWILYRYNYNKKLSIHLHANWDENKIYKFLRKYGTEFKMIDTSLGCMGGCPSLEGIIKPNLNTNKVAKVINQLVGYKYYQTDKIHVVDGSF
jgi:isopropylmalate/homocitrate/citramalate synthase